MNIKTALYRHFDENDCLLYVGISSRLPQRNREHKSFSHWFQAVTKITVSWFQCRDDALSAEYMAIKTEKPVHNKIHSSIDEGGCVVVKIPDELIFNKINTDHLNFNKISKRLCISSLPEISRATGLSYNTLKNVKEKKNPTWATLVALNAYFSEREA